MNTTFIFGITLAVIGVSMAHESNTAGIPVLLAATLFVYLSGERTLWRDIREKILHEAKESLDSGKS